MNTSGLGEYKDSELLKELVDRGVVSKLLNEQLDRIKTPTISDVFPSKPHDGTKTYEDMLKVVRYYDGLIENERKKLNE